MKRSPLARRTPLARSTPLGLRSRPKPAVPPAVRADLSARSQEQCEAALRGCVRIATDPHHRISRKMGRRRTSHDRLSNLLHLCRVCHQWITARPAESYELGLSLREHQDPAREPVWLRQMRLVLLDDAGRIHPYSEWTDD